MGLKMVGMSTVLIFLALSISCASVSFTITKSRIFKGFREFFYNRSNKKIYKFLSEFLSCPYCFSHWVSLAMTIIWLPKITNCGFPIMDYLVSIFTIIGIAAIFTRLIEKTA